MSTDGMKDARLSVLESQQNETKEQIKEIHIVISDVRLKLAQMNGALPRIEKGLIGLDDKLEKMQVSIAKTSTKLNVIWAGAGFLAITAIGYLFKVLLNF